MYEDCDDNTENEICTILVTGNFNYRALFQNIYRLGLIRYIHFILL